MQNEISKVFIDRSRSFGGIDLQGKGKKLEVHHKIKPHTGEKKKEL